MAKDLTFDIKAREKMKSGVDQLANAVKVTLGPKGRNVVIERKYQSPHITKDGVTVAKEVELLDPIENMGAQMVKEVAQKTAKEAGDGTTSATVLAQAIIAEGLKMVAAGSNPMDLKRGIDKATEAVVKNLGEQSTIVGEDNEKIKQVATVSANNDTVIGALIAEAFAQVGKDGVITVEDSKGIDTSINVVQGMEIERGALSPHFVTDMEKMICQMSNPYILVYDQIISSQKDLKDIMPALEKIAQQKRGLLIIADNVEGEALATLVVNKLRGTLFVAAIKAPSFGDKKKDMLSDIAAVTGATFISAELGEKLEGIDLSKLGQAETVVVAKENTIIVGGKGDSKNVQAKVAQLRKQIENTENDYDREILKKRLAKLLGGVAVLYVGGATDIELKEKKDRVDDALHATRAAISEGILPGGGVAYIRAIESLKGLKGENEDETTGIAIIRKSLEEPLRQIVNNAGIEGSIVVNEVKSKTGHDGYNARTGEYENLMEAGVIDPTKVSRVALQNAASIAGLLLTTECAITTIPKEEKERALPPNMM